MSHLPHEPLRELTEAERTHLSAVVRATSERADVRQRAVAVLPCWRSAKASRTPPPPSGRALRTERS